MREPISYIAAGKKGIGKTWETLILINQYARGNPAKGIPPRKVLILDVNNEFSMYKTMPLKWVPVYGASRKPDVRRITIFKDKGGKMSLNEIANALFFILSNYANGLLVIEDINKYVSDSLPQDLIGAIFTQRHLGVDTIMHFQMVGKIGHPKILGGINLLRLHKTHDSVERHKNKFEDAYEIMKVAEGIIDDDYMQAISNPDYANSKRLMGVFAKDGSYKSGFVHVDFDKSKIYGKFSKEMFFESLENYISINDRIVLRPILNQKFENGKSKFTYNEAMDKKKNDLFSLYYGN